MAPFDKQRLHRTLKVFFYNVLGVILPFLLSLIPMFILSKTEEISSFLDQGQFFLFSAGLLTSSILMFGENRDFIKTDFDKFLNFISFWLLIFCSAFYAIIYCLSLIKIPMYTAFIRSSSIILFIIAIVSIYRSVFIDSIKIKPKIDVKKESDNEINSIMETL